MKKEEKKPVVFISYSHDSEDHSERVRGLGVSLSRDGCDCRLDVHKNTGEDWPTWMTRQLLEADFVLCVITHTYVSRFRDQEQPDVGLGVGWEAGLIRRLLYSNKLRNDSIFPIFFESTDKNSIPIELQGYGYFYLDGQSAYEDLLRKIHNKPRHKKPASGPMPDLPTHPNDPSFERPGSAAPAESPPGTSSEESSDTTDPDDPENRKVAQERQRSNMSADNRPDIDTNANYAELEIELHHRDLDCYRVILRPSVWPEPDDDQLTRALRYFLHLNASELSDYSGEDLAKRLFPTEKDRPDDLSPRELFDRISVHASNPKTEFRFRIAIGASAMELHRISWESLRDPCNLERSLLDGDIFFSRHLLSYDQDWKEVRLRPKPRAAARRWLLVVSSPEPKPLPERTEHYRSHAINRLPGYGIVELMSNPVFDVTEERLFSRLSDNQGWEVLYLVCRCAMIEDPEGLERVRPALVLQDDKGEPVKVCAESISRRLSELSDPPRMVILAPPEECHDTALRIAPILLESGIACALVVPERNDEFYDKLIGNFFRELDALDRTDKAMWKAMQSLLQENKEYASGDIYKNMPVLLTRLKTSKIWYKPGFLDWEKTEDKWNGILTAIEECSLTPVLGPGLTEHIVGTRREIARHWARDCNFPMSYWDRINLPQVAQYLTVNPPGQKPITDPKEMLYKEFDKVVRKHISNRYPGINTREDRSLDDILKAALEKSPENDEYEPHRVLAELSLPLYVTTNMNVLLDQALEDIPSRCKDPLGETKKVKPVVHHLFGKFDNPTNLVLSEDEHFDYLIDVTRDVLKEEMLPADVRLRLTEASLLFLGFSLHHWDFRVLFQVLKSFAGSQRRARFDHVAVQVDPDDGYIVDPERARRYLKSYFLDPVRKSKSKREQKFSISIFWGTAEDFLYELKQRRGRK